MLLSLGQPDIDDDYFPTKQAKESNCYRYHDFQAAKQQATTNRHTANLCATYPSLNVFRAYDEMMSAIQGGPQQEMLSERVLNRRIGREASRRFKTSGGAQRR
jgi:hypothetical protein